MYFCCRHFGNLNANDVLILHFLLIFNTPRSSLLFEWSSSSSSPLVVYWAINNMLTRKWYWSDVNTRRLLKLSLLQDDEVCGRLKTSKASRERAAQKPIQLTIFTSTFSRRRSTIERVEWWLNNNAAEDFKEPLKSLSFGLVMTHSRLTRLRHLFIFSLSRSLFIQ